MTKFGETGIINLGKVVPVVGGIVGGGIDAASTKIIGKNAYKIFIKGEMPTTDDEENMIITEAEYENLDDIDTKTLKEGVEHFYGHAAVSAERSEQILKRFKLDNETIRRVKILAKYHDARFEVTEENVRRLIGKVGRDLMPALMELMDADLSGKSEYAIKTAVAHLQSLHEVYDIVSKRGDAVCIAELDITGDDLMAAGVPGGKAVGECLGKLLELVLKDPTLNKKDILLKKSILQKML